MQHNRGQLAVTIVVTAICVTLVAHNGIEKRAEVGLIEAIQNRDLFAVKRALAWGADPNCVTGDTTAAVAGTGQSAMTFAVWVGSTQIVTAMVRAGGSVNCADPEGRTPLISAIYNRNGEMCATLLSLGADPTMPGADPFDKTVIRTPMNAVAYVAGIIPQGRWLSVPLGKKPEPKKLASVMYRLLRERGVLPTIAQAIAVGDIAEVKTPIARVADHNSVNVPAKPILFADALQPGHENTNIKDSNSKEPRELLRVDVGI